MTLFILSNSSNLTGGVGREVRDGWRLIQLEVGSGSCSERHCPLLHIACSQSRWWVSLVHLFLPGHWPGDKSEGKFSLKHKNCDTEQRSMFEDEGIWNLIWSVWYADLEIEQRFDFDNCDVEFAVSRSALEDKKPERSRWNGVKEKKIRTFPALLPRPYVDSPQSL